ncbi:MAG: LiaF transmembrane domain-containing protein [Bacteroidales bacterium]
METNNKFYNDQRPEHWHNHQHLPYGRVIIGVILVLAGFMLILRNTGIFPDYIDDVIFSWPMLLVAIGLIITIGSSGTKTAGIIIMAVGAFFLIPIVFRETFHVYNMFWPSIFIIIGIIFIFSRSRRWRPAGKISESGEDVIDFIYIFSGGERQIVTSNFRGGKVTAVFGGAELDLTRSSLAPGNNILEIACVFGGITIIVPDEWDVKIEVTPVLGGFGDERKLRPGRVAEPGKQLVIKGAVVFGGGEIKSV